MKMPKPIKEYECTHCFEKHKTKSVAIKCCADDKATDSYKCGTCGETYGDLYEDAVLCCQYKESDKEIYLDQYTKPHSFFECNHCAKLYQESDRAKYCCEGEKLK